MLTAIAQLHAVLPCQFRTEVGVAHIGVVEVVEGRVAVALLVEGIEAEVV